MRMLREQGWEVHYASMGEEEVFDCDASFAVPLTRKPLKLSNIAAYRQLKKIIDREHYDIIHTHTPVGGVVTRLAARAARKRGTRIIYTAHGFHFFSGAPLLNWLLYYPIEKYMAKHTDTLVTINDEDYQRTKKNFAVDVEYIPGVGVDPTRFTQVDRRQRTRLRKEYGFSSDDYILIYAAELNRNKNQSFIINTLPQLREKIPHIQLVLCGVGETQERYAALARRLGVDDIVHFMGYRKDLEQLLQISDISVATSIREGLGLNLVEAMSTGLPVVATDNRGHRDAVAGIARAKLVRLGDEAALYSAISNIYQSFPDEYMADAKPADKATLRRFYIDNILTRMLDIYNDAVMPISISVVIPLHNAQATIAVALDSIYAQSTPGLACIKEVIVVDDGSQDNSLETVRSYKKQHSVKNLHILTQKNQGPSAARNAGIRRATGEWVAFLDADDSWTPDKIASQARAVNHHPEANIIATASDTISSTQGKKVGRNIFYITIFSYLLKSRVITSSVLAKKSSIEKAGYFDESMRYAEDQNLFMRIIAESGIIYINTPLIKRAGKAVFGERGLSGNLKQMHDGIQRNLTLAHKMGILRTMPFLILRLAESAKYFRRIAITVFHNASK